MLCIFVQACFSPWQLHCPPLMLHMCCCSLGLLGILCALICGVQWGGAWFNSWHSSFFLDASNTGIVAVAFDCITNPLLLWLFGLFCFLLCSMLWSYLFVSALVVVGGPVWLAFGAWGLLVWCWCRGHPIRCCSWWHHKFDDLHSVMDRTISWGKCGVSR